MQSIKGHNMLRALFAALVLAVMPAIASAENYRDRSVSMSVVTNLDVDRYLGKWYEIARFPNTFERGCVGVTAEYSMRSDGEVNVKNTCVNGTLDGSVEVANGRARVEGPGRLSVTFVPWLPFARVAVVGAPKGTTGWILARNPQITAAQRRTAEQALAKNGYDISKLEDVLQAKR
jgi:apolipoprotein D and lipocalin family protein